MAADDELRDLLARAAEGDDVAFRRLVEATQHDVHRLCRTLGSTGETEDLVQDTYLRVVRALPSYRGDAPVRSWVLAIARYACADHVRRRTRQRRLIDRLSERTVAEVVPAPEIAEQYLGQLSPDRREAFFLTQVMGLSYEEAADVVGCPVGTIRSRVHRAREDLIGVVEARAATA